MSKLILPAGLKGQLLDSKGEIFTDTNMPTDTGIVLYIPESDIPRYEVILSVNPDYFVEANIVKVRVLKDKDYAALLRKRYKKQGGEYTLIHVKDLIAAKEERLNQPRVYQSQKTGEIKTPQQFEKYINQETPRQSFPVAKPNKEETIN